MSDTFNATRELSTDTTITGALNFFTNKKIQKINTLVLAEILTVDTVNKRLIVKSLINGVDSKNLPIDPPSIYDVPYCAIRGGTAGIITNYVVGDTVVVGFCQRQIDITKKTGKRSTPNLTRFHALNDAIVISHWSNTEPTIFVKITDNGVEINGGSMQVAIETSGDITINSDNLNIQASDSISINATDKISLIAPQIEINGELKINGIPFLLHTHSGVTSGTDTSGPVTP